MTGKLRISPFAFITVAFCLLTVPASWIIGAAAAALCHELSHLLMIHFTGGQVVAVFIGALGARIETIPMTQGREALCAAAGPTGSFLLTFMIPFFPEAAICAAIQGLYNLIPVYPLDGGRILRAVLPVPLCIGIEAFAVVMLLGLGIWAISVAECGILPLIPGIAAAGEVLKRKIPCNKGQFAVQ